MTGSFQITVSNETVKYEFVIRRNITIIRGDSATGKTTLVEMIREYYESGENSGIQLSCQRPCRTLSGRDWKILLEATKESIIFIDEDNDFILTDEFAAAARDSDNYYVIVTREGLPNLPYSVDEIYGIRSSGRYAGIRQIYHELYHIYGPFEFSREFVPDLVIVEDSNAGYEFFRGVGAEKTYSVVSAEGKSNIFRMLLEADEERIAVIADGAAFGSEIDRVLKIANRKKTVAIFLPESFEWLVLNSGVVKQGNLQKILDQPGEYIESRDYFSWERYFTHLLIDLTKGGYLQYAKRKLNPAYLDEKVRKCIIEQIKKIKL